MKLPIEIKIKDIVITCPVFIKYYVKYCNLLDLKIESVNSVKLYLKDVVIHFNDRDYIKGYSVLKGLKNNINSCVLNPFEKLDNNISSITFGLIISENDKFNFLYSGYDRVTDSALPLLNNFDKYLDENFYNK